VTPFSTQLWKIRLPFSPFLYYQKHFKPDAKKPLIIKFYYSKSFEHRSGSYEHSLKSEKRLDVNNHLNNWDMLK